MTRLPVAIFFAALFCLGSICFADTHPIMHSTSQQKLDRFLEHANLPQVENTKHIFSTGQKDLLPLVPYVGNSRNQGKCGNCWVWAGTTLLEVALNVNKSVKKRLSIQYMNSNFNKGGTVKTRYSKDTGSFACDGGGETDFAKFYSGSEGRKRVVPWSNRNASFADANGGRSGGYRGGKRTNRSASLINTSRAYSISKISVKVIPTYRVEESQAIANIKAALDSNIAVEFDFYLPNDTAWKDFDNFWDHSDENTLFNFDSYSGIPYNDKTGGGHAVVLVGYDDTDPDPGNHYWKLLNSWGTSSLRPHGVFKIPMHMNYDNNDGSGSGPNLYFEEILPTFK